FGGLSLHGGLVWMGAATGQWSFTELSDVVASPGTVAAFLLIFGGIAAKSAQWPLHFWLPGAMAAPTPISAYLHSAAMVKAGIYLLARLWPDLAEFDVWPWIVVGFGSVTMVLGAWIALQRDILKQILAYTTVSQLGLLACAFGLSHFIYNGEHNVVWGNAQILNHALYKASLFILAGAVTHALGIKALSGLRGAWHAGGERKLFALLFLLAMIALAALPGTFSFFAKEAFLYQIWHGFKETKSPLMIALLVGTVFVSVCNVAILVRFAQTFFDREPAEASHDDHHGHDTAFWHALLWLPAALLISLQYIGGIVGSPMAKLFLPIEATPFYLEAKGFSLWYVVTHPGVPLLASVIGIVGGVLLGWSGLWRGIRGDVHDRIFPLAYAGIVNGGDRAFRLLQTGHARWYLLATLMVFVVVLIVVPGGFAGIANDPPRLTLDALKMAAADVPSFVEQPTTWLIPSAVCIAALLLVFVRDRISRVLILGGVGFSVTALFYTFKAPDLALTQLSVEIVSLVLFLLVLNLLPDEKPKARALVAPRLAIALLVGTGAMTLTLLASTATRPPAPAPLAEGERGLTPGEFFLRNSYKAVDVAALDEDRAGDGVVARGLDHLESFGSKPAIKKLDEDQVSVHKGGGGNNVVNVTLVDFRGFDTFGEVAVLVIAAAGVWTLLRKPPHRGDQDASDNRSSTADATFAIGNAFEPRHAFSPPPKDDGEPRGKRAIGSEMIASPILRTASRLLLPIALLFAAYLFFKGHQTPGGGFVGGLTAAVALVVYRMTFGAEALYQLLPVRERTMMGAGLLIAAVTGLVPLLLGLPFLTSNNGYLPLPGGDGTYHWATVLFFDLGVFLIVVGSVVGMIDALAKELE
ncbi:MAG: hydrogen gas-evolving membrane-bound hydrogenase subunit E, partial [Planctomycetota bacterium]